MGGVANQFGEFMRAARRERGLSLSGAALKAGVSKSTLSVWETGTHLPRLPELEATLDALAVPLAQRSRVLALLQCGASHEAHDWLLRAATAVESLGMEHYRDQLNALSLRF